MARPKKTRNTTPDRTDAAGTVTLACRLPGGLRFENVPDYGTLMIKGSNDQRALVMADEYGHHGITTGFPADAWEWIQNHPFYSKAKWLTSGAVFSTAKSKDAVKEAQDRGEHNVGFNGLDPEALPAKIEDAAKAEK